MFLRIVSLIAAACALASPVAAQPHKAPAHSAAKPAPHAAPAAAAPKAIGKFDDWTAATHQESGQTVCYAFTRALKGKDASGNRGQAILTVTERASGRDAVAIEAGFSFAANAAVTVQVDQTALDFYTAQRNAFARDGKAAVTAFQRGAEAIARMPAPKEAQVTDRFSLKGFSAAYAAIVKACPPK